MSTLFRVLKLNSDENQISKNLKILLSIHILFMTATSMSNIFLNVFIWKTSRSFTEVINYNIFGFFTLAITFIIGGWISKRKGLRLNLISGMILYTFFYSTVFLLRNDITPYIQFLGILRGISSGFYFVSFNTLGYDYSTDKNRDYFFGLTGIINNFVIAFSPFVSGYIIASSKGIHGYEIVFISSFVLFFIGSILSFNLPNKFTKSPYYLYSVLKTTFTNSNWTRIMLSEGFRGMRDATIMSVIITVLIYIISKKEVIVGNFSLWTSIAGIITCYCLGLLMNSKSRVKYLFIGTFLTAITSIILLFQLNMPHFWVFGIITAISLNMMTIPHNAISFAVIEATPHSVTKRTEAIVVKEVFLNIGRLTSLFIFIPISQNYKLIPYFILGISCMQIVVWLLLMSIDSKHLKKQITAPHVDFQHKILDSYPYLHLTSGATKTN